MVLLDGLYPNGPIMALCRKNKWDFMIVLQDKSLKSAWEEYEGLTRLETNNYFNTAWGNRIQRFEWVNGIEYYYVGVNGVLMGTSMLLCFTNKKAYDIKLSCQEKQE